MTARAAASRGRVAASPQDRASIDRLAPPAAVEGHDRANAANPAKASAVRRIVFVLLGLAAGVATALYVSARDRLDAGASAPAAPAAPPQPPSPTDPGP